MGVGNGAGDTVDLRASRQQLAKSTSLLRSTPTPHRGQWPRVGGCPTCNSDCPSYYLQSSERVSPHSLASLAMTGRPLVLMQRDVRPKDDSGG